MVTRSITKTLEISVDELKQVLREWAERTEGSAWRADFVNFKISEVDSDPLDRWPGRLDVVAVSIQLKPKES